MDGNRDRARDRDGAGGTGNEYCDGHEQPFSKIMILSYKATSICCVCVHLTAGQKEVKERIKDIEEILRKTRYLKRNFRCQHPRFDAHHTPAIPDHDYQFWFGDFNFRIDLSHSEVMARVRSEDLAALLANDQVMHFFFVDSNFGFVPVQP
jgi:hypothetical protein